MMPVRPQFPECKACLLRLAGSAAEAATENNPAKRTEVEQAAKRVLNQGLQRGLRSPVISSRMLLEIRRRSGVDDPYLDFKQREMDQARKLLDSLDRRYMPGGLHGLVCLAALGNSLDFFQDPGEALAGLVAKIRQGVSFHHDNLPLFEKSLKQSPKLALFLADNAGEIYFDLPLLDYLRGRVERVVLVVKGGPAQNDLTKADLERSGLIQRVGELADTGAEAAGIDWQMVSAEFLDLLERADLVVAKGMANYLSALERDLPCPGMFIFKLKCQPLRDLWDAPPESFWALWREPGQE